METIRSMIDNVSKRPFWKAKSANVLGRPFVDVASSYELSKDPECRFIPEALYPAWHKVTRQEVNVKTYRKNFHLEDKEQISALRREVAVMQRLGSHPNILTMEGAYEDKKCVHLILDPAERVGLFDRIGAEGSFSEKVAARFMRELLQGVAFCHSNNVVHRDITPENLVFVKAEKDSQLQVSNFSDAAFQVPGEVLGDAVGSAPYRAPEDLRASYGRECDIWSCGVVLYNMLSGEEPFPGEGKGCPSYSQAIPRAGLGLEAEPWPGVSRSAKELVEAMLHPDRARRITAAEALNHPWVIGAEAPDAPLGARVVQGIRKMGDANKMRIPAYTVKACNVPMSAIEEFERIMELMDNDGSDCVASEELKNALQELGAKLSDEEVRKLMDVLDTNGVIDCCEFHKMMKLNNLSLRS